MARSKKTNRIETNGHHNGNLATAAALLEHGSPDLAPDPWLQDGAEAEAEQIVIPMKQTKIVTIKVVGTAPLLVCRFSEKSRLQMLEQMMLEAGAESKPLPPLNPDEQFEGARYKDANEGWDGINILGFKGAMVEACRNVKGIHMTQARTLFRLIADGYDADGTPLARIHSKKPTVFANTVRVGPPAKRVAMPRFRPMFHNWHVLVTVQYNASRMSAQSVLNLLSYAGDGGIGDWRPSSPNNKTGAFGTFEVVPN